MQLITQQQDSQRLPSSAVSVPQNVHFAQRQFCENVAVVRWQAVNAVVAPPLVALEQLLEGRVDGAERPQEAPQRAVRVGL